MAGDDLEGGGTGKRKRGQANGSVGRKRKPWPTEYEPPQQLSLAAADYNEVRGVPVLRLTNRDSLDSFLTDAIVEVASSFSAGARGGLALACCLVCAMLFLQSLHL